MVFQPQTPLSCPHGLAGLHWWVEKQLRYCWQIGTSLWFCVAQSGQLAGMLMRQLVDPELLDDEVLLVEEVEEVLLVEEVEEVLLVDEVEEVLVVDDVEDVLLLVDDVLLVDEEALLVEEVLLEAEPPLSVPPVPAPPEPARTGSSPAAQCVTSGRSIPAASQDIRGRSRCRRTFIVFPSATRTGAIVAPPRRRGPHKNDACAASFPAGARRSASPPPTGVTHLCPQMRSRPAGASRGVQKSCVTQR
jgi:hypothetical protein